METIFEQKLQAIVTDIGVNSDTLHMLGEAAEYMYRQGSFALGEHIRIANGIFIPLLLEKYESNNVPQKKYGPSDYDYLWNFLASFSTLRDVIFYSYNNHEAVTWEMENNNIRITLNDDSILRQHASEMMTFILNSRTTLYKQIQDCPEKLLKGTKPFDFSDPNVEKAFITIDSIVDWKIRYYFSYIPENSDVMLDGYKYSTFIGTYKSLLTMALYEHYFSKANNFQESLPIGNMNFWDKLCKSIPKKVESH